MNEEFFFSFKTYVLGVWLTVTYALGHDGMPMLILAHAGNNHSILPILSAEAKALLLRDAQTDALLRLAAMGAGQ